MYFPVLVFCTKKNLATLVPDRLAHRKIDEIIALINSKFCGNKVPAEMFIILIKNAPSNEENKF
jgi:hypothetical protein